MKTKYHINKRETCGYITLLQPGAADKRDYEGTRAAAFSGLSRVGRVGGVVGMLGV